MNKIATTLETNDLLYSYIKQELSGKCPDLKEDILIQWAHELVAKCKPILQHKLTDYLGDTEAIKNINELLQSVAKEK